MPRRPVNSDSTFEEALDDLIQEHREGGEWLDFIIRALEYKLIALREEKDE